MTKKYISFIFAAFLLIGCDVAMDSLNATNGTKYIVTSKKKAINGLCYKYRLVRPGDKFYDYHYIDTAEFNIGDTLVISIKKTGK